MSMYFWLNLLLITVFRQYSFTFHILLQRYLAQKVFKRISVHKAAYLLNNELHHIIYFVKLFYLIILMKKSEPYLMGSDFLCYINYMWVMFPRILQFALYLHLPFLLFHPLRTHRTPNIPDQVADFVS